jgi:hypothetical protein
VRHTTGPQPAPDAARTRETPMLAEALTIAATAFQTGSVGQPYVARFTCDVLTTVPAGGGRRPAGSVRPAPIHIAPSHARETITIWHWAPLGTDARIQRQDRGSSPQQATLAAVEVDPRGRLHLVFHAYGGEIRLDQNGVVRGTMALSGSYVVMDAGMAHMTGRCASDFRVPPPTASVAEAPRRVELEASIGQPPGSSLTGASTR